MVGGDSWIQKRKNFKFFIFVFKKNFVFRQRILEWKLKKQFHEKSTFFTKL